MIVIVMVMENPSYLLADFLMLIEQLHITDLCTCTSCVLSKITVYAFGFDTLSEFAITCVQAVIHF